MNQGQEEKVRSAVSDENQVGNLINKLSEMASSLSVKDRSEIARLITLPHLEAELTHSGFPKTVKEAFLSWSSRAASSEEIITLLSLLNALIFDHASPMTESDFNGFPDFADSNGSIFAMLYPFAFITGLRDLRQSYEERMIPISIYQATISVLADCMEEYKEKTGRYGLGANSWPLAFFRMEGFRLGRLQFIKEFFPHPLFVFRSGNDGRVIAFYESEITIGNYRSMIPSMFYPPGKSLKTTISFDTGHVKGFPIVNPHGLTDKTGVLSLKEWELVLHRGCSGLSVHVPADGRLNPEDVLKSFRLSERFFTTFFPGYLIKAWFITSWLLDRQLMGYLAEDSNIARFFRLWYPHAIPNGGDEQFLKDVFPGQPADWEKVEAQTSLQKSLVQHVQSGGNWYESGGFILPEAKPWTN